MIKACSMGLLYYTAVFAVAFALGMARALIIAPHIGESAAVVLEVPVVVFVSWAVARQLLKRHPFSLLQSAAMGAIAFVRLIPLTQVTLDVVVLPSYAGVAVFGGCHVL
jgi:hypothetical protein